MDNNNGNVIDINDNNLNTNNNHKNTNHKENYNSKLLDNKDILKKRFRLWYW